MPENNNLAGRRVIGSVRCSTKKQKVESFPQQAAWLRDYADENQMIYVGEMREALGVSQTEKRPDIDYLLQRAATDHDFDTVLVQDLSRLTRGGLEHGLELYFAFKDVGVLLCSIVDGLIDGEEKLREAIKRFEEGRAQSKASTLNMLRGRIKSRRDGRCVYTFQIPYGIDRLYTTANGEALHIIRNLSDGTQVQLDPSGQNVLRTFGRNEDGTWNHYVKQKDEHLTLIPGSDERIAAIRRIFRRKFIDGWGQTKIAREINNDGLLSAKGRRWASSTIHKMLQNSVYRGVGIGNRTSEAIFYQAGILTPQPVPEKKRDEKSTHRRYRAEACWYEQIFPQLTGVLDLDPETSEKVKVWQTSHQKRLAAGVSLKRGGNRYPDSNFFLRGILWSKQGNHKMSGLCSRNGRGFEHRYYRVTQGRANPKDNDVLSKVIPAGMLEDAAIQVLKDATSTFTDVDSAVREVVVDEASAVTTDVLNVNNLKKEQHVLNEQIDFYVNQMSMLGPAGVSQKTDPLRRKLLDIGRRIEIAERSSVVEKIDVEELVDAVKKNCNKVIASLDGLSDPQIRHLVQGLVKRMVVDLETREATMEVHMPSWLVNPRSDIIDVVCAVDANCRSGVFGANKGWAIPIATYSCVAQRVAKQFCMDCRRIKQDSTSSIATAA